MEPQTFTLTLKMGNAAMMTPADVADALRRAAYWIEEYETAEADTARSILDQNGQRVGEWRFDAHVIDLYAFVEAYEAYDGDDLGQFIHNWQTGESN